MTTGLGSGVANSARRVRPDSALRSGSILTPLATTTAAVRSQPKSWRTAAGRAVLESFCRYLLSASPITWMRFGCTKLRCPTSAMPGYFAVDGSSRRARPSCPATHLSFRVADWDSNRALGGSSGGMAISGMCVPRSATPVAAMAASVRVLFALRTLGAVVTAELFLVFQHLAVELVGERVDRGVHVRALGVGVQLRALGVDRGLGDVPGLLHMQHHAGGGHVIEMLLDAADFLGRILAQRLGNIDLVAGNGDVHGGFSGWLKRVTFADWKAECS